MNRGINVSEKNFACVTPLYIFSAWWCVNEPQENISPYILHVSSCNDSSHQNISRDSHVVISTCIGAFIR
jgi:hypothetical protein